MERNLIDSLEGIDISKLEFSDIRVMHGTGRSTLLSGSGKNKKFAYRIGYQTKIGDIQKDVWIKLAEQLIQQAGEENILKRLIAYVKVLAWMKKVSVATIKENALEMHAMRLFENPSWVGYISFNSVGNQI